MDSVIKLENVSYSAQGHPILKDISFEVPSGSGFALLGPNGAGKTTSIRIIGGLIAPDSGIASINGEKIIPSQAYLVREKMGFQLDGSLYERLTAEENLRFWGQLYGASGPKLDKTVNELLELFQLTDRKHSKLGEFSKGMKQQIALCRAMIGEPSILVLDEPTSGLSPEVTDNVISYIHNYREVKNCTVLFCTHELFGLEKLIDNVCIIDEGNALISGSVDSLVKEYWPENKYVLIISDRVTPENNLFSNNFWKNKYPEVKPDGDNTKVIFPAEPKELEYALSSIWESGFFINSIKPVKYSLRDIYFETLKRKAKQDEKKYNKNFD